MSSFDDRNIIAIDPARRNGKPTIRGMCITVQDVLECLAGGMTEEQLLADFPKLTRGDIRARLAVAQNL